MYQEINIDKQKYHKNLQEFFGCILISFTQFIIRLLSRIVMPFYFRLKKSVAREVGSRTTGPLLIIANHKSYYDPLIIANSLPIFFGGYPLRFITKDQLFQTPISSFFFWLMGCFPTYYGSGKDKSLEMPNRILAQGGTVVFFPEGKCIREERLGEGKLGAAISALRIPNIQILPIAIHDSYKIGNLSSRPAVRAIIGKPFYLKDRVDIHSAIPEAVTAMFMKEITKLYEIQDIRQEKLNPYRSQI